MVVLLGHPEPIPQPCPETSNVILNLFQDQGLSNPNYNLSTLKSLFCEMLKQVQHDSGFLILFFVILNQFVKTVGVVYLDVRGLRLGI